MAKNVPNMTNIPSQKASIQGDRLIYHETTRFESNYSKYNLITLKIVD